MRGTCWDNPSTECERELTTVWRAGRAALACDRCKTILGEWFECKPALPDSLGDWRDSADMARRMDLGR